MCLTGQRTVRVEIPVKQPRLWWTWDLGKPELYTLETRLSDLAGVADARRFHVGIERFSGAAISSSSTASGGARAAPISTRTRGFLRWTGHDTRDLDVIQKMNVNTIRIHCHFENPEFYDLADERGLLLWQDFLEAWYPHRHRILAPCAVALYDNHIRLVRNHPSIAVWAPAMRGYLELPRFVEAPGGPRVVAGPAGPLGAAFHRTLGRRAPHDGWYGDSIWSTPR